mmetsp:Transcript_13489/g.41988  ORF Transcript_13489/g.41988 Transcript_13489/m.41988 type:complete len:206 (+) Transcript_13489:1305-1922(+)
MVVVVVRVVVIVVRVPRKVVVGAVDVRAQGIHVDGRRSVVVRLIRAVVIQRGRAKVRVDDTGDAAVVVSRSIDSAVRIDRRGHARPATVGLLWTGGGQQGWRGCRRLRPPRMQGLLRKRDDGATRTLAADGGGRGGTRRERGEHAFIEELAHDVVSVGVVGHIADGDRFGVVPQQPALGRVRVVAHYGGVVAAATDNEPSGSETL